MQLLNFLRNDFVCLKKEELYDYLDQYIPNREVNYVLVQNQNVVEAVYRLTDLLFFFFKKANQMNSMQLKEFGVTFSVMKNTSNPDAIIQFDTDLLIVNDKSGQIVGIIDNLPVQKILATSFSKESSGRLKESKYYQKMVENLGEEIFVTDGDGHIAFVNPASAAMLGVPAEDVIGRHVSELVREGLLSVSSTLEVLRTGKKADIVQNLKNGKTVLATGVPIYAGEKISMVISTSKDVDQINQLLNTVEHQNRQLAMKTKEIDVLREEMFLKEGFVSGGKVMTAIKNNVMKIAPLDMSVLVEGETGVGKEVMVKTLHQFSNRSKEAFIKINCGMIPENLMESELFGYEGGSFTGANKEGKIGKIELSNKGTLFLDEIGEMPLQMQVKLLEFLQDGTITKVGGTKKIRVDARVVAATNRDLKQMSENGLFRQDLYYRLNVMPLYVPPLRERGDDIESLARYYLSIYNSKYRGNKRFSQDMLGALLAYHWPGNIRELTHIIERLYVTVERDILRAEDLEKLISPKTQANLESKVFCTDIIPLKEAKNQIEKQLIYRAYEIHHSTYKVAEVLKIDQSTVVKLMKKHK